MREGAEMLIGVPKEIKDKEYRVAITPDGAEVLTEAGHQVLIQTMSGEESGFTDKDYTKAGACIMTTAEEVYRQADIIYKVKEPLSNEYLLLRREQILFTYLHLATNERLTRALIDRGVTGIGYETVELPDGSLPLLAPMSEIAGKVAVQVAAHFLERTNKGNGKLLGGARGVPPCTVVIIGGGTAGTSAAQIALGMGANVVIMDIDANRLRYLSEVLHGRVETVVAKPHSVAYTVKKADVLIGAVLVKSAKAPMVVTREMVKSMRLGSVVVDLAVDQGGCVETTHPTSHSDPVYIVDGVIHYCVSNVPAVVPRTSTEALCKATLPYGLKLANLGFANAIKNDEALAKGVNVFKGMVTNLAVSKSLGIPYTPLNRAMSG